MLLNIRMIFIALVIAVASYSQTYDVSGAGWVDTGIVVGRGVAIDLDASGRAAFADGTYGPEGTQSYPDRTGYRATTRSRLGLVARLTPPASSEDNGPRIDVAYGDRNTLYIPATADWEYARLWLAINAYGDVSGTYTVNVSLRSLNTPRGKRLDDGVMRPVAAGSLRPMLGSLPPVPRPPAPSPAPRPVPPAPPASVLPPADITWTGFTFTGASGETLLYNEDSETLYLVRNGNPTATLATLGSLHSYGSPKVSKAQIWVATWDPTSNLANLAIWSDAQRQWIRGTVDPSGQHITLTPTGNDQFFQIGEGAILFTHFATTSTTLQLQKTGNTDPATVPQWPVHISQTDHLQPCLDNALDGFIDAGGRISGLMILSSHCLLAGGHAGMVLAVADAEGNRIWSSPMVRVGVDGKWIGVSTVAVALEDPRYGIRVPTDLMHGVRSCVVLVSRENNQIWHWLKDAIEWAIKIAQAIIQLIGKK